MDMPDFLQLKQNTQVNNFRQAFFGDRRRTLKTLGFLVLILVIPLTVWLVQLTQIFSPRAASTAIELVSGGDCVVSTNPNQVDCATFPIRLISPLGPPEGDVTPSASPVQSSSPSASPSTSPAASASPQSSPSPSPSSVASPSPSVSPSPSPVNVAACVSSRLGISSPVATANVNGGSILYWRSPVSIDQLTSAASECGVQLLTPTNFTSSVLDTLVRSNAGGTIRSVWVAGPCSEAQVNAYRNAGIKVSADVQCNPPDIHLDYKVYPAANSLEGIGDFGPTGGDAAVFVSGSSTSNFGSQLFSHIANFFKSLAISNVIAQTNSFGTLDNGLISYWKLDETSGNAAADYKNLNNGNVSGATIVDGKFGKARNFSGAGQKIDLGNSSSLGNANNITVSAWVNTVVSSSQYGPNIVNHSGQSNGGWSLYTNLINRPGFQIFNGQWKGCSASVSLIPNRWYLVTGTYDQRNLKIYVDGGLSATCPEQTIVDVTTEPTYIGFGRSSNQDRVWQGVIDEVGIWNRALSDSEVQTLASGARPGFSGSSPSPAPSASVTASQNPSGSVATINNSIANCIGSALGLSNPVGLTNSKQSGTTLVYWNQGVNRANFLQKAADCGAEALGVGNFNDADVKSLVQGVTGAPTSSSDASKYRSVLTQDACNSQKVQEYRDAGHTVLTDSQCDGGDVNLHFKVNQYYGPGSGANPFAIFSGVADGGDTGYPMVIVNTNASSTPSATSSVDPSSRTLKYRLAETEAGLASAQFKDYTSHPLLTNFTFSDATPGSKQIWVEFVSTTNQSRIEHITVELLGDGPVITSLDCSMDVSKQNLRLTVSGRNLGASGGKITANSKDAQVNSWNENQIAATIQPDGNLEQGRQFKVAVTTNENKILPEVICEVNTSLISLGARLFCRAPGKFDVNGVKVLLVDENGNKVEEVVTIDANGLIKGLKTRLQVGKPYVLSIKAENSLRKNIEFVAANGTNVVKPADDEVLILPVGDIAPAILPDGKINVPDRSELVRQWSVLGNGSPTGDFNRDSRVNSVDWACMRFDFNREDEGIPTRARGIPSGSLIPASSNSSSPASSALVQSPSPSMSPLPSGQRAGFFLLNPIEGGTYVNGDEFIVDVNIWSQIEAANLFVAKLSFDETALEVVRIEKGQTLTTWAEEFFNNQTGQISLVAGKPSPGLKTTSGQDVRLARIVFRSKKVGTSEIAVTNESRIFSNADNANILTSLLRTQIEIVNQ